MCLVPFVQDLLGGQLSFSLVVVHSIVGDSGQLPAAIVFVMDIVCHVFQVLHVSSGVEKEEYIYFNCVSSYTVF